MNSGPETPSLEKVNILLISVTKNFKYFPPNYHFFRNCNNFKRRILYSGPNTVYKLSESSLMLKDNHSIRELNSEFFTRFRADRKIKNALIKKGSGVMCTTSKFSNITLRRN